MKTIIAAIAAIAFTSVAIAGPMTVADCDHLRGAAWGECFLEVPNDSANDSSDEAK